MKNRRPFKFNKKQLMFVLILLPLMAGFQNCTKTAFTDATNSKASLDVVTTTGGAGGDDGGDNDEVVEPTPVEPTPPINPGGPGGQFIQKQTQVSIQGAVSKVDILVVIDKSGSMLFEQASMANRFNSFITQLNGMDWRLAIITADAGQSGRNCDDGQFLDFNGSGKYVLTSQDNVETARSLFAETIQRSVDCGSEEAIKAAHRALQRASSSDNFLRNDAALSIIAVTDTNSGLKENNSDFSQADQLLNYVSQNFPGKSLRFNSIIVKQNDVACRANRESTVMPAGYNIVNQNEAFGFIYHYISGLTSGVIGNVCATDYAQQLRIIGQTTANQVREILLECAPVDADKDGQLDIEIKRNNSVISGYSVQGSIVTFNQILAEGQYSATYTCQQ